MFIFRKCSNKLGTLYNRIITSFSCSYFIKNYLDDQFKEKINTVEKLSLDFRARI